MALAKNSKLPGIVLALVCAPFCLGGLAMLAIGSYQAASPNRKPESVFGLLLTGLAFSLVGFGLLYAYAKGRKIHARQERLRERHPQNPWMWREDWVQGRVNTNNRSSLIGTWIFAVLWNLISAPAFVVVPSEVHENPLAYLALIFPAVGAGLLIRAVLHTLRWRRFGRTWFEMASVPGVIGKELRGRIHARLPMPAEDILLKLTCIRRTVSGRGKNRTINEAILWREEDTVQQGELQLGSQETAIPVRFALPSAALDSQPQDSDCRILWILSADATLSGVDYKDEFEVPVFRTAESPTERGESAEQLIAPSSAADAPPVTLDALTRSGITVIPSAEGAEYRFSVARNPGAAASWTGFAVLWAGFIWAQLAFDFPLIFPVISGLFEIVFVLVVLDLWLGSTRVIIGNGALRRRYAILGLGSTRAIAFQDISALNLKVGMQSGGRSGTPYYDIRVALRNGRDRTLASSIRDKRHAEWLLSQLRSAVALKSSS